MFQWSWVDGNVREELLLLWRSSLSFRNQSLDLFCKSMDWFLYNEDLRHERGNMFLSLPLLACDLSASVKENSDRKKNLLTIQKKKRFWKEFIDTFYHIIITHFGKYLFLLKSVCNYSFLWYIAKYLQIIERKQENSKTPLTHQENKVYQAVTQRFKKRFEHQTNIYNRAFLRRLLTPFSC